MKDGEKDDTLKMKCEALEKRCALMEQVLDHLQEGVFATGTDHRIIYFNHTEAENEGFRTEDVSKRVDEIYADTNIAFVAPDPTAECVLKTGKPIIEQLESYCSLKGKLIHLFYSCYPFFYKDKIEGVYTISRPIVSDDPYVNAMLAYKKQIDRENSQKKGAAYYFLDDIIGSSGVIAEALEQARKVSRHNMPVLIIGETGTGKEMFAQGIHNAGETSRGDFIAVNCAAVPETLLEGILFGVTKGAFTGAVATPGLFEQAEDGSIFLDEVNSMPVALQAKLLRVLQEKRVRPLGGKREIPVNCRIISSSNVDPFDAGGQHSRQIRSDLLFRLASATIYVPPLRERQEDIPTLCRHFIRENSRGSSLRLQEISPMLAELFRHYDWPGNVRELQNIISASLLNTDAKERFLEVKHLPASFRKRVAGKQYQPAFSFQPSSLRDAVADCERKIIIETILRSNGNITKAAEALQVTRPSLYYKIEKLGIGELLSHATK